MIRRTFMKALMASPLGFLIPKRPTSKYMRGEGLESLIPLKGIPVDNVIFDEIELMPQADVRSIKVICAKDDPLGQWANEKAKEHERHIDVVIRNAIF